MSPSASRPDHRSRRRSRRRQAVLACGGLSYLAAVAAGNLALLSLVAHTGVIALAALWLAGGLGVVSLVLLLVDALATRRGRRPPPVALP
jgi:hypothetical protein